MSVALHLISLKTQMKTNKGFTLIEVLIAMLVLATGLLGLSALQATSLRNSLSSYNRSQATQLAYDLADRIRANRDNSAAMALSVYNTMALGAAAAQADCIAVSTTCTAADLAENDLFEWNRDLPLMLPSGMGTITGTLVGVVPNQNMIYTIIVNWDDNRDNCVNPRDNDNGVVGCVGEPNDPNFRMSFQI